MLKHLRNLFVFFQSAARVLRNQTDTSLTASDSYSHNSPSHYYKAMAADQQRLDEAIEFLTGGMSAV